MLWPVEERSSVEVEWPTVPMKDVERLEKLPWKGGSHVAATLLIFDPWRPTTRSCSAPHGDTPVSACRVAFRTRRMAMRSRPKQNDTKRAESALF